MWHYWLITKHIYLRQILAIAMKEEERGVKLQRKMMRSFKRTKK